MLKYHADLKPKARRLRHEMTESERALWSRLRAKQLAGVHFYRQKPIASYIVDFYAPKAKLVIEIDGSQHLDDQHAMKDRRRDEYLNGLGLKVLRFNSREALRETEAVVQVIFGELLALLPGEIPPDPSAVR